MNVELKQTLLNAKPFKYLDHRELDMLLSYCEVISFSPNEKISQQGKICKGMYIIISGKAQVTVRVLGKDVIYPSVLEEGNFIGEISLINKEPAPVSVISSSESLCLLITRSYFDMLTIFFPETKYKISKAITEEVCQRLHALQGHITDLMEEPHMMKRSLISVVAQSLVRPESISFKEADVDINTVKNADFFKSFSEEECNELLMHGNIIRTSPNCVLIKENEGNQSSFVLLHGGVQVSIIYNNKIAKLEVLGPNQFVGSISSICDMPSLISYTTCERAILLQISAEMMTVIQNNNIGLWFKIYDEICKSILLLEKAADKLRIRLLSEIYNT